MILEFLRNLKKVEFKNKETHVLVERVRKPPITRADDFDNNVRDLLFPNKFENLTEDELRGYMKKCIDNPIGLPFIKSKKDHQITLSH